MSGLHPKTSLKNVKVAGWLASTKSLPAFTKRMIRTRSSKESDSASSSPNQSVPLPPTAAAPQPTTPGSAPRVTPSAPLLQRAFQDPPAWTGFLGGLLATGAITGTLLDGIHSRTGLQVYDMFALELGPLKTSLVVPPLLAAFYIVMGTLFAVADNLNADDPTTQSVRERCRSSDYVAVSVVALAAALQLSAVMYSNDVPYNQMLAVLAAVSALMWRVFDGTSQGLALALFCAVAAPASELVILHFIPLWHYSRPDVLGFVSWVPCCYCFYTPVLGTLARNLWLNARTPDGKTLQ